MDRAWQTRCFKSKFSVLYMADGRSQWPRGLRNGSAGRSPAEIVSSNPTGGMDVCQLSDRGLCDGLITRPEESYRLWCIVVCDLETSWMRGPWPTGGLLRQKQTKRGRWAKSALSNWAWLWYDIHWCWVQPVRGMEWAEASLGIDILCSFQAMSWERKQSYIYCIYMLICLIYVFTLVCGTRLFRKWS